MRIYLEEEKILRLIKKQLEKYKISISIKKLKDLSYINYDSGEIINYFKQFFPNACVCGITELNIPVNKHILLNQQHELFRIKEIDQEKIYFYNENDEITTIKYKDGINSLYLIYLGNPFPFLRNCFSSFSVIKQIAMLPKAVIIKQVILIFAYGLLTLIIPVVLFILSELYLFSGMEQFLYLGAFLLLFLFLSLYFVNSNQNRVSNKFHQIQINCLLGEIEKKDMDKKHISNIVYLIKKVNNLQSIFFAILLSPLIIFVFTNNILETPYLRYILCLIYVLVPVLSYTVSCNNRTNSFLEKEKDKTEFVAEDYRENFLVYERKFLKYSFFIIAVILSLNLIVAVKNQEYSIGVYFIILYLLFLMVLPLFFISKSILQSRKYMYLANTLVSMYSETMKNNRNIESIQIEKMEIFFNNRKISIPNVKLSKSDMTFFNYNNIDEKLLIMDIIQKYDSPFSEKIERKSTPLNGNTPMLITIPELPTYYGTDTLYHYISGRKSISENEISFVFRKLKLDHILDSSKNGIHTNMNKLDLRLKDHVYLSIVKILFQEPSIVVFNNILPNFNAIERQKIFHLLEHLESVLVFFERNFEKDINIPFIDIKSVSNITSSKEFINEK